MHFPRARYTQNNGSLTMNNEPSITASKTNIHNSIYNNVNDAPTLTAEHTNAHNGIYVP